MKRKKRIIILAIVFIAVVALVIIAVAVWNIRINNITVIGNTIHSNEEIISYIFPEDNDTRTIYAMFNKKSENQVRIPFVKSYDLKINGLHDAEIVVYEKGIIGALKYLGSYLYFDSDGYIVDTSTVKLDGIAAVEGFNFDYFVLNDKLPVADNDIFGSILVLSNVISAEGLEVDRIFIDTGMNITIYLGGIKAYLGEGTYIEKKIHAFTDIYPSISNMKGTLYLNYSATLLDTKEYFFKEEKEESLVEEETTTEPETDENGETVEEETTTLPETEGIPMVVVDEKTGEISIVWTHEETTEEETSEEETSENESSEEDTSEVEMSEELVEEPTEETTEEPIEEPTEETTEETTEEELPQL